MPRIWINIVAASGLAAALALAGPASAQAPGDPAALLARAIELYQAGKAAEALPLAEQALAALEKDRGPDHPDVATALNNLAILNQQLGRYKEAEPLYLRALSIRQKAFGVPSGTSSGQRVYSLILLCFIESFISSIGTPGVPPLCSC